MRAIARVMGLFVVLTAAVHGAYAWACSCVDDPYDPLDALASSDRVVYGEVTAITSCGCGWQNGRVHLKVTEAFKGAEVGDRIVIPTSLDGAGCGIEGVEEGHFMLVYGRDMGLCMRGGVMPSNDPELQTLRGD